MSASRMRIFGLMIVSTWLPVGCAAKKIDVGGACVLNSDCSGSLVCTWGKCHAICHTSADCPTGQSCIIASDQSTVCQLPIEAAASPADASVDMLDAVLEAPSATDGPAIAPDAVGAEAIITTDTAEPPGGPDALGFDAVKPADAVTIDIAATDLAPATLGEISAQQLHTALANKDFLLIDVHTPNEGSIPGTDARIAYTNIAGLVDFIGPDLDTKVVLTCLMGGMSKSVGNALVALGYRNISELTGGMSAWTAVGYSLVHLDGGL